VLTTGLTELLGIRHPIIGGTMMDLSRAPFVAAISNAGALGILASANCRTPEELTLELRRLNDLTDKPYGVNINLFPMLAPPDNRAHVEAMVAEGVKIVETSGFEAPAELVGLFKEHGLFWIHKCVGVRYARKVASMGADAVTVVGYENGGATGKLNVTTLVLVPLVVDAVAIPVIGGGGVADGRGLAAMLALGAQAAIVGTRLMLSDECPIHPRLKEALCGATELDTDVIMQSVGFAHRVWMNAPARKVREIEARGGGLDEVMPYVSGRAAHEMYETGALDVGTISCSQSIGLVSRVMPVRDIIAEMVERAETRLCALGAGGASCRPDEGRR
jgi:nitronate monooxygenase